MKSQTDCIASLQHPLDNHHKNIISDGKTSGIFSSVVMFGGILGCLLIISRHNYLLFHTLAELLSVAVSTAVFLLVWNSRHFSRNSALVVLGVGYLCVGTIDLMHLSAYKGMGVFVESVGADLSVQLGLAGRMLHGFSLLMFSLASGKRWSTPVVLAGYLMLTGLLLASILWWQNFPSCFIEGSGLTFFKKSAEYLVCILLFLSFLLLSWRRKALEITVYQLIAVSILLTIGVEIFLTLYVNVYGLSNLISHLLKLISFFLIYIALIRSSLTRPYTVLFREMEQITEELSEKEERFRRISSITSDVAYSCKAGPDHSYTIYWMSGAVERIFGYSTDEIRAMGCWRSRVHEDDISLYETHVAGLTPGSSGSCELRLRRNNGQIIWAASYAECVQNPGQPRQIYGGLVDITERKQGEQALENSLSLLTASLESTADGILIVDRYGNIVRWNQKFVEMWAIPQEVLLCHDDEKAINHILARLSDPDRFVAKVKELYERPEESSFDQIEFLDGRILERYSQPQRIEDTIVGRVWSFRDITTRKQVEEEKAKLEAVNRQFQKTESLNRMAGAIAHHFNNQLTVVMGNLEMAISDLSQDAESIRFLTAAMGGARKSAELSRLMLTYLGQTTGKHAALDLSDACRQGLSLLQATVPENVSLKEDLPSSGPIVNANENQIQQVMTNLVTNAWEAAEENRGTIDLIIKTVSSADISATHRFPIDWQATDLTYACLEVTDTGCGIAEENIEKLFDPFFSSKFTGRGLGLPVVLGIVKAHGGAVTVESKVRRGSAFRVFLPLSAKEVPPQSGKKAQRSLAVKEGGVVLLVEDEETMRNMTETMLTCLGFKVLLAKDGVEAVTMLRNHMDKISVVLCDLSMPNMNGWETLSALRQIRPDIQIILGGVHGESKVTTCDHPDLPYQVFLHKPYQKAALKVALERAMAAHYFDHEDTG